MRVVAVRKSVQGVEVQDGVEVHPVTDLRRLLPDATAVMICLPSTPETKGNGCMRNGVI
jgi:phosphoglycerate dehydrogenase-like enzyme